MQTIEISVYRLYRVLYNIKKLFLYYGSIGYYVIRCYTMLYSTILCNTMVSYIL